MGCGYWCGEGYSIWVSLNSFCGTELTSRHIEGVWGVDIDALRIASASHGMSDPRQARALLTQQTELSKYGIENLGIASKHWSATEAQSLRCSSPTT